MQYWARQPNPIVLKLPPDMVGQILDGLDVLAEQWEYTAKASAGGFCSPEDDLHVRECSGPDEAAGIAALYREIIAEITAQRGPQRHRTHG